MNAKSEQFPEPGEMILGSDFYILPGEEGIGYFGHHCATFHNAYLVVKKSIVGQRIDIMGLQAVLFYLFLRQVKIG